jgi:1,4-dihydroxy-2-naphthoate octaprenyltransferase
MAFSLAKSVLRGAAGAELIPLLGKTGKLQLFFAITFAIALAL